MNDEQRQALVDELAEATYNSDYELAVKGGLGGAIKSPWSELDCSIQVDADLQRWHLRRAEAIMPIIDRLLAKGEGWLDAGWDALPEGTRIEHFPYCRMQHDNMYHCKLSVPVVATAISGGYRNVYGTGPTRRAAIEDAIAKAKEPQP